jgi:hypothetical protein
VLAPFPAVAQTAQRGRLTITVADPSGAVIPEVTVTLIGLETSTKSHRNSAGKDDGQRGRELRRPDRRPLQRSGRVRGFEMGLLRDFRVNRGDNKHVVVLPLQGLAESVTVGAANQAADRASRAFGLTVTQEQIQALSDDPDEMARQLNDIGGTGAVVRIDSFEGQQLPPSHRSSRSTSRAISSPPRPSSRDRRSSTSSRSPASVRFAAARMRPSATAR